MPVYGGSSRLLLLLLVLIVWSLCNLCLSTRRQQSDAAPFSSDTTLTFLAESWTNWNNTYNPSAKALLLAKDFADCRGKERLLDILLESSSLSEGRQSLLFATIDSTRATCQGLPTFQQITNIYGSGPVVVGLETCQAYKDLMTADASTRLIEPMPRVAGLYHSGTNTLSKILEQNLGLIHYYSRWSPYEAPWGKHIPVKYRLINKFPPDNPDSPEHVLPIVIVRDPFDWMRSMCKEGYDAKWLNRPKQDCPNLFRHGSATIKNKVHVKAHQTGFKYTDYYDTLAEMWADWHRGYVNASFPRLMIRYEDLVLYPRQLVQIIADCSGKPAKPDFQYYSQEARQFVNSKQSQQESQKSLLNALRKLGERDAMYWTLTEPSRSYALAALDPEIVKLFQYQHLNDPNVPVTRPAALLPLTKTQKQSQRTVVKSIRNRLQQIGGYIASPLRGMLKAPTSAQPSADEQQKAHKSNFASELARRHSTEKLRGRLQPSVYHGARKRSRIS